MRRVGLANVNRRQLDEALELAPVAAVQVALSPYDDTALRGGVVERCVEMGIAVIAHSPLGGPRRAGRLARLQALASVAQARGATAAEVALAWLLELAPVVVPIPGARRPETARSAARAATLELEADDRAVLDEAFGTPRPARHHGGARRRRRDVVVVMGVPGAGKSRVAEEYAARGYLRLNRDERGGTLRELAGSLDEELGSGTRRVVLDNTYLTRAARSYVIETAWRHRAPVRCIWLDTPLAQAQINVVERMLERLGALPTPEELRTRAREPGVLAPTSQMRAFRELEPPSADEGWTTVERVPFARTPSSRTRPGVFVAAAALRQPEWERAIEGADPRLHTSSSTGAQTGATAISRSWPNSWRTPRPGPWRAPCARTAAVRLLAGAALRFRVCLSRSRERTTSMPRVRCSWGRHLLIARSRPRSAPGSSPSELFRRTRAPRTPRLTGSWPEPGTDLRRVFRSRPAVPRRIPTAAASCALPELAWFAAGTSANVTPASAATRVHAALARSHAHEGALAESPARTSIFLRAGEARYQPPCARSTSQNRCPGFMYVRTTGFA